MKMNLLRESAVTGSGFIKELSGDIKIEKLTEVKK